LIRRPWNAYDVELAMKIIFNKPTTEVAMYRVRALHLSVIAAAAALILVVALAGCGSGSSASAAKGGLKVVATTSFLRDIAQNVAGTQFQVGELIPIGVDPHEWQPTPADLVTVVGSDLLIVNGGSLEGTLLQQLQNAGGHERVVVASQGLKPRTPQRGEPGYGQALVVDPHWWLDPLDAITCVTNIRDAFVAADPAHAAAYRANAAAYVGKLKGLDVWIRTQIAPIPAANRVLVMNHLSHGYYADRYGLRVAGAVIPSVSTGETVSAKQMAGLVKTIEGQHVKAIFVESDENPGLADQIAAEAHVKVITDLLDHSLSTASGPAPTYLAMMRYDTQVIVGGLR
jgi:ABC-type Zn uptake system ZnuABC Zn-binding protein ZnuA